MTTLTPTLAYPTLPGFTFRPYRDEAALPPMLAVLRAR